MSIIVAGTIILTLLTVVVTYWSLRGIGNAQQRHTQNMLNWPYRPYMGQQNDGTDTSVIEEALSSGDTNDDEEDDA